VRRPGMVSHSSSSLNASSRMSPPHPGHSSGNLPRRLHRQEHMEPIVRQAAEPEPGVERSRCVILGIHLDDRRGDRLRSLHRHTQGIGQQCCLNPSPLPRPVQGKPRQRRRRQRHFRRQPASLRKHAHREPADREREISDDAVRCAVIVAGRSKSRPERIEDFDICIAEIGDVAGDDSQAVNQSSGCNQTVLDRHGRLAAACRSRSIRSRSWWPIMIIPGWRVIESMPRSIARQRSLAKSRSRR
jgi:hypothetical protein